MARLAANEYSRCTKFAIKLANDTYAREMSKLAAATPSTKKMDLSVVAAVDLKLIPARMSCWADHVIVQQQSVIDQCNRAKGNCAQKPLRWREAYVIYWIGLGELVRVIVDVVEVYIDIVIASRNTFSTSGFWSVEKFLLELHVATSKAVGSIANAVNFVTKHCPPYEEPAQNEQLNAA